MPSASLGQWRNERMRRLAEIDRQCAASLGLVPPNHGLAEENLRGYVLLLSAHFQGFCRDLYTECSLAIVARVRPSLQTLILGQFDAHRNLDRGNPNLQSIKGDFERFGFTLDLPRDDPANLGRLNDLNALNRWRNIAAHQGAIPSGWSLNLASIRTWKDSCDGLAKSLDAIMYNHLKMILRRAPWAP